MTQIPIGLVFVLGILTGMILLFLYLEFFYGKEVQEGEYQVCGRTVASYNYEAYDLSPLKDNLVHNSRVLRQVKEKGLSMQGQYRVKFFYGFITGKRYILYIDSIVIPSYTASSLNT